MAGADSSGGRLVALRRGEALALRERLLSIGQSTSPAVRSSRAVSSGDTPPTAAVPSRSAPPGPGAPAALAAPAGAQPERMVFRVRAAQLAVAVALSITGAIAAVVIAAPAVSLPGLGR